MDERKPTLWRDIRHVTMAFDAEMHKELRIAAIRSGESLREWLARAAEERLARDVAEREMREPR